MANFPQSPSIDDTHQIGDKIWTWDGEKWFADYESLSPVFQAITSQGMVDRDGGSAFELAVDPDILVELGISLPNTIGNVTVTGDQSPIVGSKKIYSFDIDGSVTDEVGTYSCDVPDAIVTLNQIEFPTIGTGKVYVEVNSATASDGPAYGEMDISVVAVPDTIGTITITGDDSPDKGDTVTYSYSIDGSATNDTAVMTAVGAGASVSGNDVTWTGSGQGEVKFEVTAPGSQDSPKSSTLDINVQYKAEIGNITITGNSNPALNDTVLYSASYDGDVSTVNATWTIDPALGATQNPIIPSQFDFTGANVGATGDITVTYVSLAAWDSPKSESITVTVAAAAPPPFSNISNITGPNPITVGDQENYQVTYTGTGTPTYAWTYAAPYEFTQNIGYTGVGSLTTTYNRYHAWDGDENTFATFRWTSKNNNMVMWTVEDKTFPDRVDTMEILFSDPSGGKCKINIPSVTTGIVTNFEETPSLTPAWRKLVATGSNGTPMQENWGNGGTLNGTVKFNITDDSSNTDPSSVNIHAIRVGSDIIRLDPRNQGWLYDELVQIKFNAPGTHELSVTCTDENGSETKDFDVTVTGDLAHTPLPPRTVTNPTTTTYDVTVISNYGNKYVIDGVQQDSLTLTVGNTYIFDQSDSSNSGHPLRIYTDSSKTTEVTDGVTVSGNTTTFVPATSGTYSYQCGVHGNMGGDITVN